MNHRCSYKCKCMRTEFKSVALFNGGNSRRVNIAKLRQHTKCRTGHNKLHIRIFIRNCLNTIAMVRFKMLNNEIIGFFTTQRFTQIFLPSVNGDFIHCVHNSNFVIKNNIGVISHSLFEHILTFKKVNVVIVYTYVFYTITYFNHSFSFQINNQSAVGANFVRLINTSMLYTYYIYPLL